jgi:alpha-beta hydrolase superfamily lysophospholipase
VIAHGSGRFRGAGGSDLFRQWWRPGRGAPRAVLVNLHGLGDHSGLYAGLADSLPPRGIAVHAYDHRGHGRSAGQRAYIDRWEDYLDDLAALLDVVSSDEPGVPIFLLGNSMGGLIALDFAIARSASLRGVVAASPALGAVGVPPVLMALGRAMSRIWPRFSLEVGMDLTGLARDPEIAAQLVADPLFHRRGTARLSTEVTAAIERVQRTAPALDIPVLLLHGGADRMVPPDGTRAFFARLTVADRTLREYPHAYHALFADLDAAVVIADLAGWIEARL